MTDRKLDKIEGKFDTVVDRIAKVATERHQENSAKIDALDAKIDLLPWKLLSWAGVLLVMLLGVLAALLKGKLGL